MELLKPAPTEPQMAKLPTPKSWRDVLPVHPAAELFPMMSEPELKEVILLRYEQGLDYHETAARLGVPLSTIQGRLKRARHALRDILMEGGA